MGLALKSGSVICVSLCIALPSCGVRSGGAAPGNERPPAIAPSTASARSAGTTEPSQPDLGALHDAQVEETWREWREFADQQVSRGSPRFVRKIVARGRSAALSSDGRFVAFEEQHLGNRCPETITLLDRTSGEKVELTRRVEMLCPWHHYPSVAREGIAVAFLSESPRLARGDQNWHADVYVWQRERNQFELVSASVNGIAGNGASRMCKISDDGRFVAFTSEADDLVAGDTNGVSDVFVRDLKAATTERASITSDARQANGASVFADISEDGRYVAFSSVATNLVPGDRNGVVDVFVHDRQRHRTERVSVSSTGQEANRESRALGLSGDGRFVSFVSSASNLITGGKRDAGELYIRDRQLGRTEAAGIPTAEREWIVGPALSFDGRLLTYESQLRSGSTRSTLDTAIVLFDRATRSTERVGHGLWHSDSLQRRSRDGRVIVYDVMSHLIVAEQSGR